MGKGTNVARSLFFLSFLLSIPALVTGVWLHRRSSSDYISYLDVPLIVLGVLLIWFSLTSRCHAKQHNPGSACITTFFVLVLIGVLFGYTIFALVVSYKETVTTTTGNGYTEYTLKGGSNWLQKHVRNSGRWLKIKRSLEDNRVCDGLVANKDSTGRYIYEGLSPIQSGCCKPPYECGFVYRNTTIWDAPKTGPSSSNSDCSTWSNDRRDLCYNCQSCKAGVVAIVRKDWKTVAIVNIVFVVLLDALHFLGFLACLAYIGQKLLAQKENEPKDEISTSPNPKPDVENQG